MLPKHAWLQAAETGQAPGPGYRDVAATQTLRSYGPMRTEGSAPAAEAAAEAAPVDKPAPKLGISALIGQNYSPSAKNLVPATLMAMLKDGLPGVEEEPEEPEEPPDVMMSSVLSMVRRQRGFGGWEGRRGNAIGREARGRVRWATGARADFLA